MAPMRIVRFGLIALALALACQSALEPAPPVAAEDAAERIYLGEIVTVDAEGSIAQAVAIRGGRILAVGDADVVLANRGPQMVVRDWRPGFTVDLQQKDLRLVLESADQMGVPLLGTGTVFQLYRTLQQQGLGDEGNHALSKAL